MGWGGGTGNYISEIRMDDLQVVEEGTHLAEES